MAADLSVFEIDDEGQPRRLAERDARMSAGCHSCRADLNSGASDFSVGWEMVHIHCDNGVRGVSAHLAQVDFTMV